MTENEIWRRNGGGGSMQQIQRSEKHQKEKAERRSLAAKMCQYVVMSA